MRFICYLFFFFSGIANSVEKINEIGKIVYSKPTQSYYFIHLTAKNKVRLYQVAVSNKFELDKIKNLVEKSVRIEGNLSWKRGNLDSFSLREELTIMKLESFELNVLEFDSNKFRQQDNLLSQYKEPKAYQTSGGISLPDTFANSFISSAAVAIAVVAGPVSLIPASLFGIYQMFL